MGTFSDYNFKTFFDKHKNNLPNLPLCHTTDGYTAREILSQGKLSPTPCPVFKGEDLLYFFYGKPTYRVSSESTAGTSAFWPVSFLIRSSNIIPQTIFPFDTGAFINKRYTNYFHEKMDIKKFELDNNIVKIKNFIKFFYGKNESYFFGKPISDLENSIPKTFFELESYYELIRSKTIQSSDDRDRSVEVILNTEINLTSKSILLAVIPTFYLDDDIFRQNLLNYAEIVYDYPTTKGNPNEYHGLIIDRVSKYLKTKKLI